MATAALVLGILGVFTGLVPLLFWLAIPMGLLALVFGLKTWRLGGFGVVGALAGVLAIVLGIIGVNTMVTAVDDFSRDMEEIDRQFEQDMQELDDLMSDY